ncbi:RNase H family protein [Pseudobacteroides cellulosolvens]|uniref:Ribonuclease H n=2 Tax=Pseudobacteroides cellulosolvens TaxID=35825 RepID=A0A0L6JPA4_9FIRM|nr:RNase H family protein [Pseudobacteroides cellulosolvens]KNY27614.1 ribonuclease H [Pseudobacteroides cellulosolvens ATCC 35603 = DSM 2933]
MRSAVILFTNQNHRPHRFAFHRQYITLNKYSANIAEINAVKTAIKAANSLGVTDLTIYHDWDGLAFFAYKSNIKPRHEDCQCYIQYAEFIERKRMNMRIRFVKVKAHSDNKLNNSVDRLARVGMVI